MMGINPKHIIAVSSAIKPLIITLLDKDKPKVIGSYTGIEKIEKDGKVYWVVVCQAKFETEIEAKKFVEIDEQIDRLTKSLQ